MRMRSIAARAAFETTHPQDLLISSPAFYGATQSPEGPHVNVDVRTYLFDKFTLRPFADPRPRARVGMTRPFAVG